MVFTLEEDAFDLILEVELGSGFSGFSLTTGNKQARGVRLEVRVRELNRWMAGCFPSCCITGKVGFC